MVQVTVGASSEQEFRQPSIYIGPASGYLEPPGSWVERRTAALLARRCGGAGKLALAPESKRFGIGGKPKRRRLRL